MKMNVTHTYALSIVLLKDTKHDNSIPLTVFINMLQYNKQLIAAVLTCHTLYSKPHITSRDSHQTGVKTCCPAKLVACGQGIAGVCMCTVINSLFIPYKQPKQISHIQ